MAGERYTTPDEDALLRMVRQAGTPEGAAQGLFARLEALEAFAEQVEAQQEAAEQQTADSGQRTVPVEDGEERGEAEPAPSAVVDGTGSAE